MKQHEKRGQRNKIGAVGEQMVQKWLQNNGYTVVDSNYLQKWGELDVIAEKAGITHFIEVKTVSYETKDQLLRAVKEGAWQPEEQVHQFKLKKISRAIETWVAERNYEGEWQIDVAAVRVVPDERYATIKYIENIIAE